MAVITTIACMALYGATLLVDVPLACFGLISGTVLLLIIRSMYHDQGASQRAMDELIRRQGNGPRLQKNEVVQVNL